jgi:abl interactor 2
MVFARLPAHEKEAFFSLLDELSRILNEFIDWLNLSCRYFSSRPDLLGHASSSEGAAGAAVQRAISSNPEAASRLISAGLKHGAPKTGPYAAVGLFLSRFYYTTRSTV